MKVKYGTLAAIVAIVSFMSSGACSKSGGISVLIDGSSTVYPITEAVAEEFISAKPDIRIKTGISGTGGGFKKFLAGETDINDASRTIKDGELKKAAEAGIGFIELPVAFDGIAIVVNPANDFVDYLTVAELKMIWQPDSQVKTWQDVRPSWPAKPIALYGPGTDSGTFDYFTEEINGKSQASRPDFTASEDDNVIVMGISGDIYSLGYFGFSYYTENRDKVKAVPVDSGSGPVSPDITTINDGSYTPLSRPLFIYVNEKSASRNEVSEFVDFYIANAPALAKEAGYVPFQDSTYTLIKERFDTRKTGSAFFGKKTTEAGVESVLKENR